VVSRTPFHTANPHQELQQRREDSRKAPSSHPKTDITLLHIQ
jgi:hypothetical protein